MSISNTRGRGSLVLEQMQYRVVQSVLKLLMPVNTHSIRDKQPSPNSNCFTVSLVTQKKTQGMGSRYLVFMVCFLFFFLALLDYVSRAPEIEIRPSSVRLWHRLSLKLLHGLLSNFSCGFPRAIWPDVFIIFEKKFFFDF